MPGCIFHAARYWTNGGYCKSHFYYYYIRWVESFQMIPCLCIHNLPHTALPALCPIVHHNTFSRDTADSPVLSTIRRAQNLPGPVCFFIPRIDEEYETEERGRGRSKSEDQGRRNTKFKGKKNHKAKEIISYHCDQLFDKRPLKGRGDWFWLTVWRDAVHHSGRHSAGTWGRIISKIRNKRVWIKKSLGYKLNDTLMPVTYFLSQGFASQGSLTS